MGVDASTLGQLNAHDLTSAESHQRALQDSLWIYTAGIDTSRPPDLDVAATFMNVAVDS